MRPFQQRIDITTCKRAIWKVFAPSRGFGFIESIDGSEDVLLHANNIAGMTSGDDLWEGQTIGYETEQTEKDLSAITASPAEKTSGALG